MILDRKTKQPNEVKDYPIDYSEWLSDTPGQVLSSVLETRVDCLTDALDTSLSVVSASHTPTGVNVRLSGGTDQQNYKVTLRVQTSTGQVDESEFLMRIKEV